MEIMYDAVIKSNKMADFSRLTKSFCYNCTLCPLNVYLDCSKIWMRLFDHRPFLNGEIKFMLREFEEKRSDREIENLFSVIENAIEIKDNQIDRLKQLSSTNLPTVIDKLDEALEKCNQIQNIEKEKEKDTTLEQNRLERKKEWADFIEDITEKYVRIDNAFEQKEEELKDFYADLEHKLNLTTK